MLLTFPEIPKTCWAFTSLLALNLFFTSVLATRLPNRPPQLFLEFAYLTLLLSLGIPSFLNSGCRNLGQFYEPARALPLQKLLNENSPFSLFDNILLAFFLKVFHHVLPWITNLFGLALSLFLAFLQQESIMFISKLCNTEHEFNKSWINVIS